MNNSEICSYCGNVTFDVRHVASAQELYDISLMGVAAAAGPSLFVCSGHSDLYDEFYNVLRFACALGQYLRIGAP